MEANDLDPLALDYDLYRSTIGWVNKINYSLIWRKVDSHIEDKLKVDPTRILQGNPLSWRLNAAVDLWAGKQCAQECQLTTETFFPASVAMVTIGGSMVYGSIYDALVMHVHSPTLIHYLCTKFKWTEHQFNTIHWDAMESYINTVSTSQVTNISKLVMDWQNNNRQNNLFDKRNSELCPVCNLAQEDHMHYLHCSDPVIRSLNRQSWNKVVSTIRRLHTTQSISAAFYNILEALMHGRSPVPPHFPDTTIGELVKQAWCDQEALGWVNVAKGRICRKWGDAQGQFYKEHPDLCGRKYCTSFNWTKHMVAALLEMSLKMWKNRCDCLHGYTQKERLEKRRKKLKDKVEWCYRHRRNIPAHCQYLFRIDLLTMCDSRSPYYPQRWVDTFDAVHKHARKEYGISSDSGASREESQSSGTYSSRALEDYT